VRRGLHDATADWAVVEGWLRQAPTANWAVRTGPIETGPWAGRHLAVLDIDDVLVAAAVLERTKVQELTAITRTPKNGLHIWALSRQPAYTGKVLASNGSPLGDLKGTAQEGGPGGYVLVFGQTEDGDYDFRWGPGPILVDSATAWFESLLSAAGVEARLRGEERRAAYHILAERPAQVGERNVSLFSYACALRNAGLGFEDILRHLLEMNTDPSKVAMPLPQRELEHIAASACRYPSGKGDGHGDNALPLEVLEREVDNLPTDYAHGRIIAQSLRGRACYVPSWGWMTWTGQRWERDEEGDRVAAWAAEALRDHYIERARAAADPKEQAALLGQAAKCLARARVTPALAFAKAWLRAEPQDFDQHPYLLNTPAGVLDLQKGEVLPHAPSLRLTRMTSAPYDPDADCPTFRRFLLEIFAGNERLVAYVQRLLGHALIAGNPERVFAVLWGRGGNGKSTLVEAVSYALGDYAQETPPESFLALSGADVKPRNDLARLHAVRLVTASEARDGSRLDAAIVKRITGGDRVVARFLYREFFEFTPGFLPVLRTNFKPKVSGEDQAVWDRLRLVPFTVRIPPERQDRRLLEKLKAEASGILKWLVEGCRIYLERGLEDPPEVLEATARYRAEVDDLYRFLEERTERAPDASVQASVLYQAYKDWAQQEGAEPVGAKRFGEAMLNLGYERYEAGGKRYYRGLRLKEPLPPGDVEGVEGERQNPIFLPPTAGGPGNFSGKPSTPSTPSTDNPRAAFEAEEPPHPPQPCPRCRQAGMPGYYACESGQVVTLLRVGIERERHVLRSRQAICFNSGLLRAIEPDFLVVSFTDGGWGWVKLQVARQLGHEGEFGAERQLAVPLSAFTWEAAQGVLGQNSEQWAETLNIRAQNPEHQNPEQNSEHQNPEQNPEQRAETPNNGGENPEHVGAGAETPNKTPNMLGENLEQGAKTPNIPGENPEQAARGGTETSNTTRQNPEQTGALERCCPACGKPLGRPRRGPQGRWCSPRCRMRFRRRGDDGWRS
jgi:P4 family phage/plasmid primase-like protien